MSSGFPPKQTGSLISDERIKSGQLELLWNGSIQESTVQYVLQWLERRLESSECLTLQKKRLVRVTIELLQNLYHHSPTESNHTRFMIGSDGLNWTITTENELNSEGQHNLRERWNQLMLLSPDEWRQSQREKLAFANRSAHGGGGIGLNEILRKTNGQLDMTLSSIDQSRTLVRFTAQITPTT